MTEILLTNDDGVHSPGILTLADALSSLGEVTIVAPDRERSGASQSLTLQRPIRYEQMGPRRYSVEGTPTDCVIMALHHILPAAPALVISGINKGANLGRDVNYSGTVAGALEAASHGIPALAVSLAARESFRFEEAARFTVVLAERVLSHPLPPETIWNVNVPAGQIKGVRITSQGRHNFRNLVVANHDPRGRKYYWFDQQLESLDQPDGVSYDYVAVREGYVSLTPLRTDRTVESLISMLEAWPDGLFSGKQA